MPKFFWALTQILLSCACFMEKDPMIVADILFSFFKNPIWCCKINTKNEESYFCCDKKSFKLNELLSFRKLCVELDSVNVFRMTCFLYTFWYIFVFVRKIGKDLTTVLAQKYIIYSFHFLLIHFFIVTDISLLRKFFFPNQKPNERFAWAFSLSCVIDTLWNQI